jgi:ParB family transcriptional regulator, chromosome partitioning protein
MTPPSDKPRRLGRGLEALLAARPDLAPVVPEGGVPATAGDQPTPYRPVPIAEVRPNPYQPRKEFRDEELADLEASLKATGLLQPITVRVAPGGGYELVAGERRLRAAQRIGWTEIPAIVKAIDDRSLATFGLVENLQRVDLNPIEEALGYQQLVDQFSLTQQQVADVVGKDRSTVANMLRLLGLPAAVRRLVQESKITLGHARALLALGDERAMTELARRIVAEGLTVRDVERSARQQGVEKKPSRDRAGKREGTPMTRRIEDDLRRHLQTDVRVSAGEGERGTITISFYSADDLERVLDLVLGSNREQM